MDPRFLPFQIAAGLLLAAFIILLVKLGMNIFRNNTGLRGFVGGAMFAIGVILGYFVVLAGFGA